MKRPPLFFPCGFQGAEEEATDTLETLLEKRIVSGGIFPVEAYSDSFWENIDTAQWGQLEGYLDKTHGKLSEYTIIRAEAQGRKKGLSSAGWVGFRIHTTFEKGIEGIEQINFYRAGKDEPFYIISQNIETDLMREEANRASQ